MADDDFPTEYDAVVLGTGMTECIVAAAMSRIGMKVLHLDRNDYYSGDWAVFNFKGFQDWVKGHSEGYEEGKTIKCKENLDITSLLNDGELAVPLKLESDTVSNVKECRYIKSEPDPEPVVDVTSGVDNATTMTIASDENKNKGAGDPSTADSPIVVEEDGKMGSLVDTMERVDLVDAADSAQSPDGSTVCSGQSSPAGDDEQVKSEVESKKEKTKEWTMQDFNNKWRHFNLDLSPKVLFSRGALVELLISSDIAKYCDFKLVNRVLTYYKGQLKPVPCSRADVFSSKDVSIIEKRMMMKLLTFCMEFDKHPEQYSGFEDKTFLEFLKSKNLSENILHYVLNSIAMATEHTPTLEGLKRTQRFLQSLGRYGNTPFLWPLYGSGEIPQCFCRMCAVFGGLYCLRRTAHSAIMNQDNQCVGIVCNEGVRIKCSWLVMESSFAPHQLLPESYEPKNVSRGVLITDRSILPSDDDHLTLLSLPPQDDRRHPVAVYELPQSSAACPKDLYVVHLTCPTSTNAEEDLSSAVSCLFGQTENGDKPRVLWATYYNMVDTTECDLNKRSPSNIFITSGPGGAFHYEHAVKQAKEIFDSICPGEEFCPRAPNPEDIIFDGVQNEPSDPGFQNGSDDGEESGADGSQQGADEQDSGVEGNSPQDREW